MSSTGMTQRRSDQAPPAIDPAKQEQFLGKVLTDMASAGTMVLASIGDYLGLFKTLDRHGAMTSVELADRTDTNERYVREWLGAMASGGYLDYDSATGRFTLPPEHVAVLAQEKGPMFCGGTMQALMGSIGVHKQVVEAFRKGGGVPQSEYSAHMWEGIERFTGSWFENLLLQVWMPLMPDVHRKLEQGATLADVGCGRGRALIKLAEAYPKSRFVGYDIFEPTVGWANQNANQAGVGDRVSVHHQDVVQGLPEQYDLITTFDVVHDAGNPQGLLDAIRQGLKDDGIYLCLDMNCSDKLEENGGPIGSLFHGFSVLYCMTTSLAQGGVGLGTLGFHPPMVNEMCGKAGFDTVRQVPIENPFNNLYEIRA